MTTSYYQISEIPFNFLNSFLYATTLTVIVLMFSDAARLRPSFCRRIPFLFLQCAAMSILGALLLYYFIEDASLKTIIYFFLSSSAIINMLYCYRQSVSRCLYAITLGITTRNALSRLVKIVMLLAQIEYNSFLCLGIQLLVTVFFLVPFWILFARKVCRDENFQPDVRVSVAVIFLTGLILPMNILEDQLEGKWFVVYCCFLESLIGFALMLSQYLIYSVTKRGIKAAIEQHVMQEQLDKSEDFKRVIDVMNRKVHDLKHQIRELRGGAKAVTEGVLEELDEVASEYEAFVDTGNAVVNTVLTEKYYLCLSKEIQFTVMLNGRAFDFMEDAELYSLFGNLLDNAIESVSMVEKENRFIRVSCTERVENMIALRVENYYRGQLAMNEEGLPITTKSDKLYHGFGVKSIKDIARKYGGDATYRAEDGLFKVNVLLYRK